MYTYLKINFGFFIFVFRTFQKYYFKQSNQFFKEINISKTRFNSENLQLCGFKLLGNLKISKPRVI